MTAAARTHDPGITQALRAAPRRSDFPDPALGVLREAGWLAPSAFDAGVLFERLVAAGRGDLSAGRLFEGHVNALHLIERYGAPAQVDAAHRSARAGGLGGVWAASDPENPARLDREGRLQGRLGFCSGADKLAFALAAVTAPDGSRRLIRLDPSRLAGRFRAGSWRVRGMEATRSHTVSLCDLTPEREAMIGGADDYLANPFFSAGAVRFAAVQTGGVLAVFDAWRAHLQHTERWRAEAQAARLSAGAAACEAVFTAVGAAMERLGPAIDPQRPAPPGDGPGWTAVADGARQVVANAAPGVIEGALTSVGAAGLAEDHPLGRAVADLQMYLRQPAPDAARKRHGEAIGSGELALVFDPGL